MEFLALLQHIYMSNDRNASPSSALHDFQGQQATQPEKNLKFLTGSWM